MTTNALLLTSTSVALFTASYLSNLSTFARRLPHRRRSGLALLVKIIKAAVKSLFVSLCSLRYGVEYVKPPLLSANADFSTLTTSTQLVTSLQSLTRLPQPFPSVRFGVGALDCTLLQFLYGLSYLPVAFRHLAPPPCLALRRFRTSRRMDLHHFDFNRHTPAGGDASFPSRPYLLGCSG